MNLHSKESSILTRTEGQPLPVHHNSQPYAKFQEKSCIECTLLSGVKPLEHCAIILVETGGPWKVRSTGSGTGRLTFLGKNEEIAALDAPEPESMCPSEEGHHLIILAAG